ncbi:MAG: hydroxymethylglutaryl-CoA reductase, degradative [Bacteriovoracaceae bacterium]|nr:hydroxymethylglutaryl-CoA reductase, degradative [Bacteriovoracaceae bacterium]
MPRPEKNAVAQMRFSQLTKAEKKAHLAAAAQVNLDHLACFDHPDPLVQEVLEHFSENTLANFPLPYGIVPQMLINGREYWIPMVTEESSVVAAVSKSAKFWRQYGGFKTTVGPQIKLGHVHFLWQGDDEPLTQLFAQKKAALLQALQPHQTAMQARGGGVVDLALVDGRAKLEHYYQLALQVKTGDAMGANFINTLLEVLAQTWQTIVEDDSKKRQMASPLEIIMAILSNHTPQNWAMATATCPSAALGPTPEEGHRIARKIVCATEIAQQDIFRAATHNKGIMNGVDAVLLATGNDFRAVEAGAHCFAAQDGHYRGLSKAFLQGDQFTITLQLPLALGTVGGVTKLHPLAQTSLQILQNPNAAELMQIIAAVGLGQNFAALRALVSQGIHQGHMKMHLHNLLLLAGADPAERAAAGTYFAQHPAEKITPGAVAAFLARMRQAD